ncbi:type I restriction modification DNA specificity protein [Nitrosomonas ureae]|uniref:restriction endonuclease subunit S n=1 Tax=Nitrosomonas ureae TaxID=44577 RepID=UPI000D75FE50|nr:restriction endonuclease subunit S [Nitrosomonas ureae]PXX10674.1 type I restriction modification DNA specificity protein [Nitrosomonas ureae]
MENNWGTDLPENWTKATISDLVGVQGVFRDGDWVESKDQDQNGQVRLIQLADIGDGEFRDKSSRFLISEKAIELNCTFLQAGDILVARMPDPLGRACLFPLQGNKQFVTVVDVCIIRFGNNYTNIKYFMYLLNSPMSRRSISDHQTGSTRKRISRGNLSTVQFPIAPLNEQHRIVAKIEELFSELDKGIENLKTAQAQLKVYRQALLKHAFEGKLTAQWRAQCRAKQTVAPAQAGAQLLNDMDSRPTPSRGQAMRGNDEAGSGNDEPLETAEALLKRIQQERAQRYQQQLAEWEKSPSVPLLQRGKPTSTAPIPPLEKGGRGGISKPKPPKSLPPLTAEELAELPELPEGWGWVKVGTVSSVGTGITPLKGRSDFYANGNIPWVTSGALNDNFVTEASDYVTDLALKETNLRIYPKHTLLIALYGEGKTRGKCSELLIEAATNQAIAAIVQEGMLEKLRKYMKKTSAQPQEFCCSDRENFPSDTCCTSL